MKSKALVVKEYGASAEVTDFEISDLEENEVLVKSHYTGINYKDALAVTSKGRILKDYPLVPGIDVAGVVTQSKDSRFKEGDEVLCNGRNLGEIYSGGYSEYVKLKADNTVPLPKGLSAKEAMTLGTAGFTAALSLERMETNGQTPEKGPIVVTGATGGVGSFAINILSKAGYKVDAVSGKEDQHGRLKEFGANNVTSPAKLDLGKRPLEKARWGGAIDNVGGDILAGISRHVDLWGNIACVGLAASHELNTTVMPLILRGVSLLGVSSNNTPMDMRHKLWQKLANQWRPTILEAMVAEELTSLEQIPEACQRLLDRKVVGRIIVKL